MVPSPKRSRRGGSPKKKSPSRRLSGELHLFSLVNLCESPIIRSECTDPCILLDVECNSPLSDGNRDFIPLSDGLAAATTKTGSYSVTLTPGVNKKGQANKRKGKLQAKAKKVMITIPHLSQRSYLHRVPYQ